ncbi:MAG: GPW/gp25 family protein [Oscillospiraceae bacterium]|nr:GPW/gp25 family protein [Oscillospiraceae bacterium]
MSYTVTAEGAEALTLSETDTVANILQNIAVLLQTRQGTCPLYREFGLPMKFLDRPMPAAAPLAVAEITEAITTWEPRAMVKRVTFSGDAAGVLRPVVEVDIENGE